MVVELGVADGLAGEQEGDCGDGSKSFHGGISVTEGVNDELLSDDLSQCRCYANFLFYVKTTP
jgi:hypothetical protein